MLQAHSFVPSLGSSMTTLPMWPKGEGCSMSKGFRDLGFRVLGFRVLGFRVWGLGLPVLLVCIGLEIRVGV